MNVQSLRVMIGGSSCNARCPYCVTQMVSKHIKEPLVNWRRLGIACNYALKSGATTLILGGVGEPTLYPESISEALNFVKEYDFPLIELQTNGTLLNSLDDYLKQWSADGLTTIQLSIVNQDSKVNSELMNAPQYDLSALIKKLHDFDYSVRLSCILFKDSVSLDDLISFAKSERVDQVVLRSVIKPYNPSGPVIKWVDEHSLNKRDQDFITDYLEFNGTPILNLPGGGAVYDVGGQNVAFTEADHYQPSSEDLKNLVVMPSGRINFDRRYKGAVLL